MTSPCRILLVDDEQEIVELIQLRLEAQGYEIATAPDGLQALRVLERFQPHLILCDVVMPVMDGPTLCRKLRAGNNRVPFIFLTAKGQSQDIVGVLSAGADDYVVKPFDPGELLARIKANLRRDP
jgi:DNA-binding response OmpR family regulator